MFVDVEKDGRIKTILTNSAAEDSVIVKHPQAREQSNMVLQVIGFSSASSVVPIKC